MKHTIKQNNQIQSQLTSSENNDHQQTSINQSLQNQNHKSKINKNFYDRARAGLTMLFSFMFILLAGQFYCCLMIIILSILTFKQLDSIKKKDNNRKFQSWYIFAIFVFFRFSEIVFKKYGHNLTQFVIFFQIISYRSLLTFFFSISFLLYFCLNSDCQTYRQNISYLGWNLMSCIFVTNLYFYALQNTLQGQLWFTLPALLIALNDIFAYFVGYFFGIHKLISISPKKTWQGYLGSSVITFIMSFFLSQIFIRISGITCPLQNLNVSLFYFDSCQDPLLQNTQILGIQMTRFTSHIMLISLFISIIGPFGGFFASGLKRSLKIKDFSNLIPGHGGVTDRLDCELFASFFIYYYIQYVRMQNSNFQQVWVQNLTDDDKLNLFNHLKNEISNNTLIIY